MAQSDREYIAKLVKESEERIFQFVQGLIENVEKLFNTKIAPIEKTQDRHTADIGELYEANRKITDRFFAQDAKTETVKSQIMQQGERFGGKLEELEKDIDEHKKDHDKTSGNTKWIIGFVFSGIIGLAGLLWAIIGG